MSTDTQTFKINGMSYASCALSIEKALNKRSEINNASVNFASEELLLNYDSSKINPMEVTEIVKNLGYSVKLKNMKAIHLKVGQMTCSACSTRIEKVLNKQNGVFQAVVNLANETANIKINSDKISLNEIISKIEKIGYSAQILNEDDTGLNDDKDLFLKSFKTKLIGTFVFSIPLLLIAMLPMLPITYSAQLNTAMSSNPLVYALIQLLLCLPVMVIGKNFYTIGLRNLTQLAPNMDSLIAVGTLSAFLFSAYNTYLIYTGDLNGLHQLYFESSAVIISLVMLGKYFEAISKSKTNSAIKKLIGLQPKTAIVVKNQINTEVDIAELKIKDHILVKAGQTIPVDGEIIEGDTKIDESMLTGEPMAVKKMVGSRVSAGSINGHGLITIEATKIGKDTLLSQIIKLVGNAQNSKAPLAKLADRVAGVFVPIVILIAIISASSWYLAGMEFNFVLKIFIAVLVIACPCALGLATPTAIMAGMGKGAELGILIKDAVALENAHKVNTIVFDKTGTLTLGKPVLTDIVLLSDKFKQAEILQWVSSAEVGSEHPLASAVIDKAKAQNLNLLDYSNFETLPGRGLKATVLEHDLMIGNQLLLEEQNFIVSAEFDLFAKAGKTPVGVLVDGHLTAVFAIADQVKPDSFDTINKLNKIGFNTVLLTGDHQLTADTIAKELGIKKVISQVLPDQKANTILELKNNNQMVAMVGDGINDAPSLAYADLSIAMGSGSDIAIESADMVLMSNKPSDILTAIGLSKETSKNIKQNLFWAFIYNIAGIPIAAGLLLLFDGPTLNPMIASLAMAFSSVSVVVNALRLKGFKANNYQSN